MKANRCSSVLVFLLLLYDLGPASCSHQLWLVNGTTVSCAVDKDCIGALDDDDLSPYCCDNGICHISNTVCNMSILNGFLAVACIGLAMSLLWGVWVVYRLWFKPETGHTAVDSAPKTTTLLPSYYPRLPQFYDHSAFPISNSESQLNNSSFQEANESMEISFTKGAVELMASQSQKAKGTTPPPPKFFQTARKHHKKPGKKQTGEGTVLAKTGRQKAQHKMEVIHAATQRRPKKAKPDSELVWGEGIPIKDKKSEVETSSIPLEHSGEESKEGTEARDQTAVGIKSQSVHIVDKEEKTDAESRPEAARSVKLPTSSKQHFKGSKRNLLAKPTIAAPADVNSKIKPKHTEKEKEKGTYQNKNNEKDKDKDKDNDNDKDNENEKDKDKKEKKDTNEGINSAKGIGSWTATGIDTDIGIGTVTVTAHGTGTGTGTGTNEEKAKARAQEMPEAPERPAVPTQKQAEQTGQTEQVPDVPKGQASEQSEPVADAKPTAVPNQPVDTTNKVQQELMTTQTAEQKDRQEPNEKKAPEGSDGKTGPTDEGKETVTEPRQSNDSSIIPEEREKASNAKGESSIE